ncbi:hypothetical protein EBR56_02230, partial [bacterium]|nr:hypothetical protein [bacterium]
MRVIGLALLRAGSPGTVDCTTTLAARLDARYPSHSPALDRELCRLLTHLGHPAVARKTLDLLAQAATQEDQVHYAYCLRALEGPWTIDERDETTAPAGLIAATGMVTPGISVGLELVADVPLTGLSSAQGGGDRSGLLRAGAASHRPPVFPSSPRRCGSTDGRNDMINQSRTRTLRCDRPCLTAIPTHAGRALGLVLTLASVVPTAAEDSSLSLDDFARDLSPLVAARLEAAPKHYRQLEPS